MNRDHTIHTDPPTIQKQTDQKSVEVLFNFTTDRTDSMTVYSVKRRTMSAE